MYKKIVHDYKELYLIFAAKKRGINASFDDIFL